MGPKQQALADALCEALILIDGYHAALGPIFTPPSSEDTAAVVHTAQAALRLVGAPSSREEIHRRVHQINLEREAQRVSER